MLERKAKDLEFRIKILPRLGLSSLQMKKGPEKIIAFQLMGAQEDGNLCPFLDLDSESRSPHGGYNCSIYAARPLACQAYPVLKESKKTVVLDSKCAYSCMYGAACSPKLMNSELLALQVIKKVVRTGNYTNIWRYATHVGESKYRERFLPEGWYLETSDP